ncbi:hypothetical protein FA13DRAFT_1809194 [Coprinellus micaceus]|uniref:Uncharacterized protein n=1 Tax=Coprinellus micaceus TaxID=71717 RepID=A0A4Y7TUX5_COPMI|nr:hypothetical protein FA13DRAFT_1809194 [Coprinellus micaceus]
MDGQGAKTEVEVLRGGIDELKRDKADLRNLVELLKNELARTKDETVCEVAKAKTEGEARVRGLTAEYGVELGELRNKVDELEKALREKEERAPWALTGSNSTANASSSPSQTRAKLAQANTVLSGESFAAYLVRPCFVTHFIMKADHYAPECVGGFDAAYPPKKRKAGEGLETEAERAERYESEGNSRPHVYAPEAIKVGLFCVEGPCSAPSNTTDFSPSPPYLVP